MKLATFFKDKDGRVVIWQWPSLPIYGWLVCKIVARLVPEGHLQTGFEQLSMAFLFTWAFLEITKGVSYFRRALGLVVMVLLVMSFLTQ
jgi:hypothetical protein